MERNSHEPSNTHVEQHPHDDGAKRALELDHPDMKAYNEESAAEIAVPSSSLHDYPTQGSRQTNEAVRSTESAGVATGWAALILAVLSWVVWPVVLGATAVVVGFIAFWQGARGLGITSITLGLIAVVAYLVLVPIYYAVS